MSTERAQNEATSSAEGAVSFAVLGTDFLDVLALFVRTIPLYPDGHGRVVAVSDRLKDTAASHREPVVVEVADRGLIVNGEARVELAPGPKALRDALLATAVVRVVFQPSAPSSSYVSFARSLQRNARLATNGKFAFGDLWMAPIPGIEVSELLFGSEGFVPDEAEKMPDAPVAVLGSATGDGALPGSGTAGGTAIDATKLPEPEPAANVVAQRVRRVANVSRDVRELALEHPTIAAALVTVENRLLGEGGDGARKSRGGADVLEHLIRALPLEARVDPAKALVVLERVLDRLMEDPRLVAPAPTGSDLPARFLKVLQRVFPSRVSGPSASAAPNEPTPAAKAPDAPATPRDAAGSDEAISFEAFLPADADTTADWVAPELTGDDGITDSAGVTLHALLEEPEGERRDLLRAALVEAYAKRPRLAPPPCILVHLAESLAEPAATRNVDRIRVLASIVDDAGLDYRAGASPLSIDLVASIFPQCLGTYVRAGGRSGAVARRIGRESVLAASAQLLRPRGPLTGETLDRVLSDRTLDVLPFVEVLVMSPSGSRARAVRALRAVDLKSPAAVALRVVPEDRFTQRFLQELCADGFAGVESRQLAPEAAAALGAVVLDKEGRFDTTTRCYAVAALGSFPPLLAEVTLRAVAARKFLGSAPKEVRRAAEETLERFARAAADARPVP